MMETKPLLERFDDELTALQIEEPMTLEIDRLAIVVIISQMQVALRHPANTGQAAEDAREICRQLRDAFDPDSAIAQVIGMGWNPTFDMPMNRRTGNG